MKKIIVPRPEKIKTPLGERLTEIRKSLGYQERLAFAEVLGVLPSTLGNYERGDREPDLKFLKLYRQFKINLNWIADGSGNMFTEANRELPAEEISKDKLEIILKIIKEESTATGLEASYGDTAHLIISLYRLMQKGETRDNIIELLKYRRA